MYNISTVCSKWTSISSCGSAVNDRLWSASLYVIALKQPSAVCLGKINFSQFPCRKRGKKKILTPGFCDLSVDWGISWSSCVEARQQWGAPPIFSLPFTFSHLLCASRRARFWTPEIDTHYRPPFDRFLPLGILWKILCCWIVIVCAVHEEIIAVGGRRMITIAILMQSLNGIIWTLLKYRKIEHLLIMRGLPLGETWESQGFESQEKKHNQPQ